MIWRKRFAWLPTKVVNRWAWLNWYYVDLFDDTKRCRTQKGPR